MDAESKKLQELKDRLDDWNGDEQELVKIKTEITAIQLSHQEAKTEEERVKAENERQKIISDHADDLLRRYGVGGQKDGQSDEDYLLEKISVARKVERDENGYDADHVLDLLKAKPMIS